MDVQVQRVILLQYIREIFCDPHGHKDRNAAANTQNFQVRDLTQAPEQILEDLRCQ